MLISFNGGQANATSFIPEESGRRPGGRGGGRACDRPGRTAGGQVAYGDELDEEPRYALRRRRAHFQALRFRNQRQVPDPGVRRRGDRSRAAGPRRRAERDGAVRAHGAVLLLRQGPDVRLLLRDSVRVERAPTERVDVSRGRTGV